MKQLTENLKVTYTNTLITRLLILLLIPFFIFQFLATKITLYTAYLLLKIFGQTFLIDNFIFFNKTIVEFIPACSASLAYYLLFFLIILTKDIKFLKRIKIFLLGSLIILIVNLIRIIILILILDNYGIDLFNKIHILIWSFIGSIFVALVWIFLVRIYNINSIPIYSDFIYLLKKIKT